MHHARSTIRGALTLLAWLWPSGLFELGGWRRRLPAGTIAAILMGVTAVAAPSIMHPGQGELSGARLDRLGSSAGGGFAGGAEDFFVALPDLAGQLAGEPSPSSSSGGSGSGGSGSGSGSGAEGSPPPGEGGANPATDDELADLQPAVTEPPPLAGGPTGQFQLPIGLGGGSGSVAYGGSPPGGGAGGPGGGGSGDGGSGGGTPGDPGGDPGGSQPGDPPIVEPPPEQPGSDPGGVTIFDPPAPPVAANDPSFPALGGGDPPQGDPRDPPTLLAPGLPDAPGGDADPIRPGDETAVPEPATWVAMILGLGAVGAVLRRRRGRVLLLR